MSMLDSGYALLGAFGRLRYGFLQAICAESFFIQAGNLHAQSRNAICVGNLGPIFRMANIRGNKPLFLKGGAGPQSRLR